MSVKDKLENLLDSANNTTGKTDADLTTAIKSLEDGYGGGGSDELARGLISGTLTELDVPEGITQMLPAYATIVKCKLSSSVVKLGTNFGGYNIQEIDLGSVQILMTGCFRGCAKLTTITIPSSIVTIDTNAFRGCTSLTTVIFEGDVPAILSNEFYSDTKITLYDFSNHSGTVPKLNAVADLGHSTSGCTIKVPSALLEEWQNTTNWVALTNVTWEGV